MDVWSRHTKPAIEIRMSDGTVLKGKMCSNCQTAKPYEEFHKLRRSADGKQNKCKICKRDENAKRSRGTM